MALILTNMAKRIVPKVELPIYIEEWLLIRGMTQTDLAGALEVAEETVWRWVKSSHDPANENARRPDTGTIRAIEEVLDLEPGGLYRLPAKGTHTELLAGLDSEARKEAIKYIEYLKNADHGRRR